MCIYIFFGIKHILLLRILFMLQGGFFLSEFTTGKILMMGTSVDYGVSAKEKGKME